MRRFTRVLTLIAFACAIIGLLSWSVTGFVAIPAAILGATVVLCAAFPGFGSNTFAKLKDFGEAGPDSLESRCRSSSWRTAEPCTAACRGNQDTPLGSFGYLGRRAR